MKEAVNHVKFIGNTEIELGYIRTSNASIVIEGAREDFVEFRSIKNLENQLKNYRNRKINQLEKEISFLINHDEYLDGEISKSELFMSDLCRLEDMDFVLEALMKIYAKNLLNVHMLEGILVMISSVPYEVVEPRGQIMAMGLLSNKELAIRDTAIQCFEKWNSKKGLQALESLECEPIWLQRYVEKIIEYIKQDGED